MKNNNEIIYFSSLIYELEKYSKFWESLKTILDENEIQYKFIQNTKDIWCRDYMPGKRFDEKQKPFNFIFLKFHSFAHVVGQIYEFDLLLCHGK